MSSGEPIARSNASSFSGSIHRAQPSPGRRDSGRSSGRSIWNTLAGPIFRTTSSGNLRNFTGSSIGYGRRASSRARIRSQRRRRSTGPRDAEGQSRPPEVTRSRRPSRLKIRFTPGSMATSTMRLYSRTARNRPKASSGTSRPKSRKTEPSGRTSETFRGASGRRASSSSPMVRRSRRSARARKSEDDVINNGGPT